MKRLLIALLVTFGLAWACGFDSSLREYLNANFWMPFTKKASDFAKAPAPKALTPYAGMKDSPGAPALAQLRAAYQQIATPNSPLDSKSLQRSLASARAVPNLSPLEREEVDLLDAKIDLRADAFPAAKQKLQAFLGRAQSPAYRSEARGWLAYAHFLLGEQTAAGKIYLDELNRPDSNLSRETLENSLRRTYDFDGGPKLLADLESYFDTAPHAAFAIYLLTNSNTAEIRYHDPSIDRLGQLRPAPPYARIKALLEKHSRLLQSETGANALALLSMRAALSAGDPPSALRLAARVPATAAIRREPDFLWMLASAHFLSRQYAAAEGPLLALSRSPRSTLTHKAAAAYGLCGVYQKLNQPVEQLRHALWLDPRPASDPDSRGPFREDVENQSIHWGIVSGWDAGFLLDAEAPIEALRAFIEQYPKAPQVALVRYSLAVRLARENQFDGAAQIFDSLHVSYRSNRMRRLAVLYGEAYRADALGTEALEAKLALAQFLFDNDQRVLFNDRLWGGLQTHFFYGAKDTRLTAPERIRQATLERKLKDDQEERWRAYLILREVVTEAGPTPLGRRSAELAIRCVRRISDRFDRPKEIRDADIELSVWLRRTPQ